jgi:hypothetical protein
MTKTPNVTSIETIDAADLDAVCGGELLSRENLRYLDPRQLLRRLAPFTSADHQNYALERDAADAHGFSQRTAQRAGVNSIVEGRAAGGVVIPRKTMVLGSMPRF